MPLEDLTGPSKFIGDLVREWPLGIDPYSEGDDHIRGLKNVILNTFGALDQFYDIEDAAFQSQPNDFTDTNQFQAAVTCLAKLLQSGAAPGPALQLLQENASPASADLLGQVAFEGRNSAAGQVKYAELLASIVTPTAAAEDGELVARILAAGAVQETFRAGKGLYMNGAAVGDMGVGTINAQNYYKNGIIAEPQVPLDETIISTPTVDYVLSWDNADDWRKIEISITDLVCQNNNAGLLLETSQNGGSSYHTSYNWRRANIAGSYGSGSGIGVADVNLTGTGTSGLGSAHEGQATITISNPGLNQPSFDWSAHGINAVGTILTWLGSGKADQAASINAVRIKFQSTFNIAQANIKASAYK